METDFVREFATFTETMTYARAAKSLFMSANTLTAHIAKLEEQLGAKLVDSADGGLVLTPAGRVLVRESSAFLSSVDRLKSMCASASETSARLVLVGRTVPQGMSRFDAACQELERRGGTHVELVIGDPALAAADALKQHDDADAAFWTVPRAGGCPDMPDPGEGLGAVLLGSERLVFSAPVGSDLCGKERVRAADLDGHELLCLNDPQHIGGFRVLQGAFAARGARVEMAVTQGTSVYEYLYGSRPDKVCWWNECEVAAGNLDTLPGFRFFQAEGLDIRYDIYLLYRLRSKAASAVAAILAEGAPRAL